VPWRDLMFDYAMAVGTSGDWGMSNSLGVGWNFGAERKPVEGPKFFMKQEERTMAVSTFDPQGVSATDAAVVSDMLRNQLIKEGAFNLVEKANMDKILGEQAFQQTGCTTSECAVKLGKVLNVKFLVVGSMGKLGDSFVISMRVIDVETAKAVYSDEFDAKGVPEVREGIKAIATRLTEAVKKAK
jgi:TolB-like protein